MKTANTRGSLLPLRSLWLTIIGMGNGHFLSPFHNNTAAHCSLGAYFLPAHVLTTTIASSFSTSTSPSSSMEMWPTPYYTLLYSTSPTVLAERSTPTDSFCSTHFFCSQCWKKERKTIIHTYSHSLAPGYLCLISVR